MKTKKKFVSLSSLAVNPTTAGVTLPAGYVDAAERKYVPSAKELRKMELEEFHRQRVERERLEAEARRASEEVVERFYSEAARLRMEVAVFSARKSCKPFSCTAGGIPALAESVSFTEKYQNFTAVSHYANAKVEMVSVNQGVRRFLIELCQLESRSSYRVDMPPSMWDRPMAEVSHVLEGFDLISELEENNVEVANLDIGALTVREVVSLLEVPEAPHAQVYTRNSEPSFDYWYSHD